MFSSPFGTFTGSEAILSQKVYGKFQGGSDKVLGLRNTSTSIIAFLTFQSRLHMLADCAPRPNVHTLSHGRALYCIRAPGMSRTYVAKEPYGGLGLIV